MHPLPGTLKTNQLLFCHTGSQNQAPIAASLLDNLWKDETFTSTLSCHKSNITYSKKNINVQNKYVTINDINQYGVKFIEYMNVKEYI